MGSSDGEGLLQLYLELVDVFKKKIYASRWTSRHIKVLSSIEKLRKSFKTLSELKLKFIPKAWQRDAVS